MIIKLIIKLSLWELRGIFLLQVEITANSLISEERGSPRRKLDLGWLSSTLFMFLPGTPVTKTDYERKAYRCIQSEFYTTRELSKK